MSSRDDRAPPAIGPDLSDPLVIRDDLERGVRFLHTMAMETKLGFERVDAVLRALLDSLVARGALDAGELATRVQAQAARAREDNLRETHVEVDAAVDKYAVTELPDVDCASLMSVCLGRCCKLHFPLSFQDLDERIVQWRYDRPYRIRQRDDGYCVHSDPVSHGCTVYEHRPVTCRRYDCRKDPRVWIDFENRIAAPLAEVESRPVMLYQIGLKKP
jgi:Fe-S-cluster containining protein